MHRPAGVDKPIAVLLALFLGCLLTKLGEALEQIRGLAGLATFSKCLNHVVERGLVGWIHLERFAAFGHGLLKRTGLQIELGQDRMGRFQLRTEPDRALRRPHRLLEIRSAWLGALLEQNIGFEIKQDRIVGPALKFIFDSGKSAVQIVLLNGRKFERSGTERLIGVQAIGILEIRLRHIVLGKLHVKDAAGKIESRIVGVQGDAVVDDIDADHKRLVCGGHRCEIHVKLSLIRIKNDGLP